MIVFKCLSIDPVGILLPILTFWLSIEGTSVHDPLLRPPFVQSRFAAMPKDEISHL